MAVARVERLLVGVEALIFGEEAGVDVEHPVFPARDEFGREQAHVTGEGDILDASCPQLRVDDLVELGAFHALVALGEGRDAFGLGEDEACGVRVVGGDEDDLIGAGRMLGGVKQRRHVGPTPGYENADFCLHHIDPVRAELVEARLFPEEK